MLALAKAFIHVSFFLTFFVSTESIMGIALMR